MPARRAPALAVLSLALLAGPAGSARSGEDLLGLFADEAASVCAAPTAAYSTTSLYVIARLDALDALMAAEFAIAGWPGSPGYPLGQCTPQWNSPLVIGALDDDFAIAFSAPLSGPLALLGRLDFLPYTSSWPGTPLELRVIAASARDAVILVDGEAAEYEVLGGRFTFNCSENCNCGPAGTASLSIGEVKQLY